MMPAARILVVHDEPALGELLLRVLREEGYAAVATDEGPSAWAAAAACGEPFSLLVTNYFPPGLTGAQILELLRQEHPSAPILHVEGLHRPRAGNPHHLSYAPFRHDLFLAEVKRVLAPTQTTERV
jgi:CheY-like chemotaxis protein